MKDSQKKKALVQSLHMQNEKLSKESALQNHEKNIKNISQESVALVHSLHMPNEILSKEFALQTHEKKIKN